jgi:Ca2+-binding RTX toxin-like protein
MTTVRFAGNSVNNTNAFDDFNLTTTDFAFNNVAGSEFNFEKVVSGRIYSLYTTQAWNYFPGTNTVTPNVNLLDKQILEILSEGLDMKGLNLFTRQTGDIETGLIGDIWNHALAGDDRISVGGSLQSTNPSSPVLVLGNASGAIFGDFSGTTVGGDQVARTCGDDVIVLDVTVSPQFTNGRITVSGDLFNVGRAGTFGFPSTPSATGTAICGDDVIDAREVSATARLGLYGDAVSLWDDSDFSTVFGDDVLRGGAADDLISGDSSDGALETGGNDFLFGNGGADALVGGGGNDYLDGGVGADTMNGGLGNDTYAVRDAGDVITDAGGNDLVRSFLSAYTLAAPVERGVIFATNGELNGNARSNVLTGNAGDNIFRGNAGNDAILGAEGGDVINGGLGNDVLTGGAGQDRFIFNTAPNPSTNRDVITDFTVVDDTIRLDDAVFVGIGPAGALVATAFKIVGVPGGVVDANDRVIYDKATGSLTYDSNGSAAGGATLFAIVNAGLAMTAADFSVI